MSFQTPCSTRKIQYGQSTLTHLLSILSVAWHPLLIVTSKVQIYNRSMYRIHVFSWSIQRPVKTLTLFFCFINILSVHFEIKGSSLLLMLKLFPYFQNKPIPIPFHSPMFIFTLFSQIFLFTCHICSALLSYLIEIYKAILLPS